MHIIHKILIELSLGITGYIVSIQDKKIDSFDILSWKYRTEN